MFVPVLIGIGSLLAAGGAFELHKRNKAKAAATAAAANAQVLQPQPQQSQAVAVPTADPAIAQAAQQAAAMAQSQQDQSGPDPGTVPAGTSDPQQQQIQLAANIAATQAQIAQGNPPRDTFVDPATGLQTSATGPNTNGGALQSSDPSLVNQIQNVLGI